MSPTDLKLERLKRVENNADVSPRDLMTLVIDAMEEGFDGAPSRAIVIIETKRADGTYGIETFRAGCSRYEEIALTALHHTTQIEKWRA